MDAASFLSSIVEVAIGIAGFAGIIAAIRQRGLSKWPKEQLILLQILFFASAVAILFALLPAVLVEAGISEPSVWKLSGGGLLVWLVAATMFRVKQSRVADVDLPVPKLLIIWILGTVGLQIYNIATDGVAWPYLIGITTLIINGFTCFLLLLLNPYDETEEPTIRGD